MEQWHAIRCLHARGLSGRQIAQQLGISRNTVARALRKDDGPDYTRSAPVTGESPHDDFIRRSIRRGLKGSRILTELRSHHGYHGSQASFYRRLRELKDEQGAGAALRFETEPGQQAQFDWSEYVVPLGGALTRLYVFGMVLGYCRRCHWFPSLSVKQPDVFEAIEACWQHFGGACRELVVDNTRTLVTRHTRTELVWNERFLRLCGHYRVQPIAGTPRHPQGKGKVEHPFGPLETHFIQGNRWSDFDAFQQALGEHEARWEQRTHGTTGAVPAERFREEESLLLPLPRQGFLGVRELPRQVSGDCLVPYQGVRYSVPAPYAGKQVWVRPSQGRSIEILAPSGVLLATHRIAPAGQKLAIQGEHYEVLRKRHQAGLPTLTEQFRRRFGPSGEMAEQFLQRFIGQATHRPDRALSRLLELLEAVPEPIALRVLRDGLDYNLLSTSFLEGRIQHHMQRSSGEHPPTPLPAPQLPLPELDVERPLAGYAAALLAAGEPDSTER